MSDRGKWPFEVYGVECSKGWEGLYQPLIDLCKLYDIEVCQVKEKFGGLRFYIGGRVQVDIQTPEGIEAYTKVNEEAYKKIGKLIAAAEAASFHTCEECGEDGWEFDPEADYQGTGMPRRKPKATTGPSDTSAWIRTLCAPCREKWDDQRRKEREIG